eukprot:10565496-Heterocapsa_arctica.AAC.1
MGEQPCQTPVGSAGDGELVVGDHQEVDEEQRFFRLAIGQQVADPRHAPGAERQAPMRAEGHLRAH